MGDQLDPIQLAAQEQFARQSGRYGRGHILENIEDVVEAITPLHLSPGSDVLDVATGAGHTGLYLASLGYRVTLADIAEPMLQRASEAAAARGLSVQTRQHAAEQFPDQDASFDLVTCRVAAHHFSSPEAFVQESNRVLKPGGYLIVIDGSVQDDQTEAEEWLHKVEKFRDPSHHRLLTPRAWSHLCEASGLRVQSALLTPFKQPDLNWYFETAATSAENRIKVIELVKHAPDSARNLFKIANENGKLVWWWQRLTLVAQK